MRICLIKVMISSFFRLMMLFTCLTVLLLFIVHQPGKVAGPGIEIIVAFVMLQSNQSSRPCTSRLTT